MTDKSLHDGTALYRRTHPSTVSPEERDLPDTSTAFGRGQLVAIANGSDAKRRREAIKALEEWREKQQSGEASTDGAPT